MTAEELIKDHYDHPFRVGKSKIVWESASYRWRADKIYISRIVPPGQGGKPFLLGLFYKSRLISKNTIVHLVKNE